MGGKVQNSLVCFLKTHIQLQSECCFNTANLITTVNEAKKTELSILKSTDPKVFLQENLQTVSKSLTLANKAIRVV